MWSCDTGQWIPCFDRCQFIVTWMSNIKEVLCKPWLIEGNGYEAQQTSKEQTKMPIYARSKMVHDVHNLLF